MDQKRLDEARAAGKKRAQESPLTAAQQDSIDSAVRMHAAQQRATQERERRQATPAVP